MRYRGRMVRSPEDLGTRVEGPRLIPISDASGACQFRGAPMTPRHGDTRTVRCFAWLPVVLIDRRRWWGVAWLEHYLALQEYVADDPEPWGSVERWETRARHSGRRGIRRKA